MRARFGDFILDLTTRELLENGEPRHLSPKAFLVLEQLVEHAPSALTKDVLYKRVWGDTFVDEVNLANLVSEVRAALHDNPKAPRYVKTIHRYGYAFAAEVTAEAKKSRRPRARMTYSLYWRKEEFPLGNGVNTIGRGDDADVIVDSQSVSRRHANVVVSGDTATVEDLGSKNGTFVNDTPVNAPTALADGDEVRVGQVTLSFRAVNRAASTVTQMTR
jgi:DNA-binding winged helix-turn-helix (wHTH) protein